MVSITVAEAPGGIAPTLLYWHKADEGVYSDAGCSTAITSHNGQLNCWTDQTGNMDMAELFGGDAPDLQTTSNLINFNPVVRTDNENERIGASLVADYPSTELTHIMVTKGGNSLESPYSYASTAFANEFLVSYVTTSIPLIINGVLRHSATTTPVDGNVHLYIYKADGTISQTYENGLIVGNGTGMTATTANGTVVIAEDQDSVGGGFQPQDAYQGDIAEIATYDTLLSRSDQQFVESYFALKYGITLNTIDSSVIIEEGDYLNSTGAVIWDGDTATGADASYHANVAGIGRDDPSKLDQRKSKSSNTGSILTIGNGNDLNNPAAFSNNLSALIWGHDGAAATGITLASVGGTSYERMLRVYKARNTNSVGPVSVEFDLTGLGLQFDPSTAAILIDDTDSFSSPTLHSTGVSVAGSVISFNSVYLADGDFFTLVLTQVPDVTLSVDSPVMNETGGSSTVTATLSNVSNVTVLVDLAFTGSATAAGDYSIGTDPISIPPGDTSGTSLLTAITDTIHEGNELIIVDIISVSNGNEDGVQQESVTILDDDSEPTVTLTMNDLNLIENFGVATFTVTLSNLSVNPVTVYLTHSGTATETVDYISLINPVIIPPLNINNNGIIVATPDPLDEADETIIVDISSVANGTENGMQQGTTTILDDDVAPTVTLTRDNANIPEDGSTIATFTATLNVISGQDVTVDLGINASSTAESGDYSLSSNQIIISAGSMSDTATVTAVQDMVDEDNETVVIDITGVTNGTESGVQQQSTTITDDDSEPGVILLLDNANIDENGGQANLTAILSAISERDVTVNLTYSGTATGGGQDYTAPATIVVSAGDTFNSVTIDSVDDLHFEDNETVIVDIDSVTNGTEVGTQQETTSITDDDENLDTDGDGIINKDECPGEIFPCPDTDGDGVPDYLESAILDTDGDFNSDEDNDQDADNDSDGDGTADGAECASPPDCADTDMDGIPDYVDADDAGPGAGDSDGDGIDDDVECPSGWPCPDTDGDGIPNYMDLDSDGDGIDDLTEGAVADEDSDNIPDYLESNTQDTDGDGDADYDDSDADGDGEDDDIECGVPGTDPVDCVTVDLDGDGIPDHLDADKDGDGVIDGVDSDPTDPDDPNPGGDGNDSDGDGVKDDVECPSGVICPDSDGDNIPDYMDTDSDNDGIDDSVEGASDTDGDGIPDRIESNVLDSDGDGDADFDDTNADDDANGDDGTGGEQDGVESGTWNDTDDDGIPDHLDGDDAGPGAGDTDGDGIDDDVECTTGYICPDSDGDGIPDYADDDSDNDGIDDATEGTTDTDLDGIPDRLESNTLDSDNDGNTDHNDANADDDANGDDGTGGEQDTVETGPWNDTDSDGIPDHLDGDDAGPGPGDTDGDGIPDDAECPCWLYLS